MRVDHHAYMRATRVAGLGFLLQCGLGLTMLLFGLLAQDTAFLFSSLPMLYGLVAWLGLIVLFNQHTQERLEALEEDALLEQKAGTVSVFEGDEDIRVAGRRLRLMQQWLMPIISLALALLLAVTAWILLRMNSQMNAGEAEFLLTVHKGWGVAICLVFAAISFIFSRFVAGMAKQPTWQNLRGGASFMVGNAVLTMAVAIGISFRFFHNDVIMSGVAYAVPIFMWIIAMEIILNFILNLYRPRIAGEMPRPAFDSKLLSLLAAPDSLVRSINEAVNFQFGFDVTSSWGYQLLSRRLPSLLGTGLLVLLALNMLQVIEPHQQAVRLRFGQRLDETVHTSGIMWKYPWPVESVEMYDVSTIRELHLTSRQVKDTDIQLWTDDLGSKFDVPLDPFVVGFSRFSFGTQATEDIAASESDVSPVPDAVDDEVSTLVSLVDAEVVLQYRIQRVDGLQEYLAFCADTVPRRGRVQQLTIRDLALKGIALREVSMFFRNLTIDQVLSENRSILATGMQATIQKAFDRSRTGIEVVAVNIPLLRPAGSAAPGFEELSVSNQRRQELVARAKQTESMGFAALVGDPGRVEEILEAINEFEDLRLRHGSDDQRTRARRGEIEDLLVRSGGEAGNIINSAERDRWVRVMGAKAQANRVHGQFLPYKASPALYRQRETMRVYMARLPGLRKYVLGIDPERVEIDFRLEELDPLLQISDALADDAGTGSGDTSP